MTTVFSPHDIHTTERRAPTRDLQEEFDDEVSYDDEMPPPAPLNSDDDESDDIPNTKDDTFDTLDEFGEDTLHILRDADLRLGCVPPLSSLKSNDEDDLDEEASTEETLAESSLLRGPLMAAKSLACLKNATTPSTARAAFMTSCKKSEKEEATPSTAKSTLHSIKPTREQITPSNFIISTQKPPLSHTRDGNTPSAMRHRFIPSPQDSISTMGSGGSGVPLHHHGVTPSAVRRGFMDTPKEEGVFTFDCVKDPNDNVNNNDKAIANGPNKSQNDTPQSSIDKVPTKSKPYLKRGTRKEPSSLHTSTPTTESSDERKSRLDKLEKMQEQLRLDYERREARKREAQRERRLNSRGSHGVVKSEVKRSVKEKLVESTTKALESVAVVGRSVSTVRDTSFKIACETFDGIVQQKDVPTPSQVRCSSPVVENQVANMKEVACSMEQYEKEESNVAQSQSKKTRPRSVSRSKVATKPTSDSLKSSRVEDNEKPRSVSRPKTAPKHMSSSLSPKRQPKPTLVPNVPQPKIPTKHSKIGKRRRAKNGP
jgi:hypothetical protein